MCYRLFISSYGWPLYLTTSIASNLCLLIQFISSQGLHFLFKIFWILRLKNWHFIFLTILWNCFQSSKLFDDLYLSKSLLQLLSHQLLECFVMLMTFEFFSQAFSIIIANSLIAVIRQKCGQTLGLGLGQIRYSSSNYWFMMRERACDFPVTWYDIIGLEWSRAV